jgi:hypothetical protein
MKDMAIALWILAALAAVVVVLAVVVAMKPAAFRIARSATITAPPSAVFEEVNDLRRWEAWSPWAKVDPGCKMTYDGKPSGVGAIVSWSGNSKVGEGRMTITDSRPDERIRIKLEFFRPFKATNTAEFTFTPQVDETAVTWTMTGERNFMCKGFSLICDMDKMVGRDFEKGLAQLNAVVQSSASSRAEAVPV